MQDSKRKDFRNLPCVYAKYVPYVVFFKGLDSVHSDRSNPALAFSDEKHDTAISFFPRYLSLFI
jgi:hypothetical protein